MLYCVRMDVNVHGIDQDRFERLKADEKARAQDLQHAGKWLHLWRVAGGVVRLASPANRGSLLGMTMSQNPYRGFRFPPEVIQHAMWPYHCSV